MDRLDRRRHDAVFMVAMEHHADEQYKECRGYAETDRNRVVIAAESKDCIDRAEEVARSYRHARCTLSRAPRNVGFAYPLLLSSLGKRGNHCINLCLRNTRGTWIFHYFRANRFRESGGLRTHEKRQCQKYCCTCGGNGERTLHAISCPMARTTMGVHLRCVFR